MKRIVLGYVELSKPSITVMVLISTALGFFFAERGIHHVGLLCWTLLGSALTCAGSAAINHFLEREEDALMERTKNRPIPTGLISPHHALNFGIILILSGLTVLCLKVNLLTAFLSLLTSFLYILVYTPMKKMSWLNTTIGAIPGAIPPMGGWAAARSDLGLEAWVLFFILFAWQHPHFFAIAWMCKEDYKKAGFKMLSVIYPDGKVMFQQAMVFAFLLLAVSILPSWVGMSGRVYLIGAILLGIWILSMTYKLLKTSSLGDARSLLKASVIYLPALFLLIIADVHF